MKDHIKIRSEFVGEFYPLRVTNRVVVDGCFTVPELRLIADKLEEYQKHCFDNNL